MRPVVLYLAVNPDNPSQRLKLAGMRRYAGAVGWDVVCVAPAAAVPANLPALLRLHAPVGCVADGPSRAADLPPRLFGQVPVVYVSYESRLTGGRPSFHFDGEAIARMALRELSSNRPPCYAAVGFPRPRPWSVARVAAFRRFVLDAGARCFAFHPLPLRENETNAHYTERLATWLARLPEHCAVFAVSDETAVLVARAAQAAMRHIPKELTLCSIDNFADLCESAPTPITSVQLDFERMGFLAAMALGELVGNVNESAKVNGSQISKRKSVLELGTCNHLSQLEMVSNALGPLLVVRRKSTSGHGRHEPWIMEAIETIRAKACDGLSAAELIGRYPVSKRLFTMRFREATGHSVLDEIIHVRLEKAFTLLARTRTPIGKIPALCGFNCNRTLDAIFRKRFGMSMRDWRKRNAR